MTNRFLLDESADVNRQITVSDVQGFYGAVQGSVDYAVETLTGVAPEAINSFEEVAIMFQNNPNILDALVFRNGSQAMTGDLQLGGHQVTGLAAGVASTDASTKGQTDAAQLAADNAQVAANNAQSTADTAVSNAATAQTAADVADTKATSAGINASAGLALAQSNGGRIDNLEIAQTAVDDAQDARLTAIELVNTTQDTKNTTQDGRLNVLESDQVVQDNRMTAIESLNTTQNLRLDTVETVNGTQNTRLDDVELVSAGALQTTGGAMTGALNLGNHGLQNAGSITNPGGDDFDISVHTGILSLTSEEPMVIRKVLDPLGVPAHFNMATFGFSGLSGDGATFHYDVSCEADVKLANDATAPTHAVRKSQLESEVAAVVASSLQKTGGVMSGSIQLAGNQLQSVGAIGGYNDGSGQKLTCIGEMRCDDIKMSPGHFALLDASTVINSSTPGQALMTKLYVDSKALAPNENISIGTDYLYGLRSVATEPTEATSKAYVENTYLPLAGGTLTGDIDMSARRIKTDTNYLKLGSENGYGVRTYGDHFHVNMTSNSEGGIIMNFGNTAGSFTVAPYQQLYRFTIDRDLAQFDVPISMGGHKITSSYTPVNPEDLVNKAYVDGPGAGWTGTATSNLNMGGYTLFNATNVKSSKLHPYADGQNISTYFLKGFETEVTRFTEDGINMLGGSLLNCGQVTFATNTLVNLAGSQLVNPSSLTTISNNIFNVYRGSNSSAFLGLRGDLNAIQFHDNGGKIMGCDAVSCASFAVKNLAEDTTYASFGASSEISSPLTLSAAVTLGADMSVSGRTLNTPSSRLTIGTTWGTQIWGEYFEVGMTTNGDAPIVLGHGAGAGYMSIKKYGGAEGARFTSGVRIDMYDTLYTGSIYPRTDNTYSMGTGSLRFTQLYAASATINTSDERQKENIVDSDLGLDFVNALRPVKYTWKNAENVAGEAVEYLQPDGTYADTFTVNPDYPDEKPVSRKKTTPRVGVRPHYGMLAQEVKTVIDATGTDFAGYIHDATADTYGLRYSEFIAPLIKAVQELSAANAALSNQVNLLTTRVTALENSP
jgi:hypothetical protein